MNILQELKTLLELSGLAVETGIFSGAAPDEYAVITPLADTFDTFADNMPQYDAQEARISLYSKHNYQKQKDKIVKALLSQGFHIYGRMYVEYENDTGYHHYAIDAAKYYNLEE